MSFPSASGRTAALAICLSILGCQRTEEQSLSVASSRGQLSPGFTGPLGDGQGVELLRMDDGTIVASSWVGTSVFLPASNTWASRAAPPIISSMSCVVRLPGNRILRAGGNNGIRDAMVFNYATNTWAIVGQLNSGRTRAACATMADGRVLIVGGLQLGQGVGSAEVFDPTTNTWTVVASPSSGHTDGKGILLQDGRVLFANGTPEVFDPATGTFSFIGASADGAPVAARLANGLVLFVNPTAARLWNPSTGVFQAVSAPPSVRTGAYLVAHGSGGVLLGGAAADGASSLTTVEQFDPTAGAWTTLNPLLQAREGGAAMSLPEGYVLAVGAFYSTSPTSTTVIDSARTAELLNIDCAPLTCAATGASCGVQSDGCGATLQCGTCSSGLVCVENQCTSCVPSTCSGLGFTCGAASDGCGGSLDCGSCAGGSTCVSNRCLAPAAGAVYDPIRRAPACSTPASSCDTGASLVFGRGPLGPETNAPNTLASSCPDGVFGTLGADESLNQLKISTIDGAYLGPSKVVRVEGRVNAYGPSGDTFDVFVAANAAAPSWQYFGSVAAPASGLQTLSVVGTLPFSGGQFMAVRGQFRFGGSASHCTTGAYDDRDDLVFNATPPDVTGPTASFSSPASGAIVRDVISLVVQASDPSGVQLVSFLIDGVPYASIGVVPTNLSWDSATVSDGVHTITARAIDYAGNVTVVSVPITTSNAPALTVLTPTANSVLSGSVALSASGQAVAGRAISSIEYSIDGQAVGTATTAPWSVSWNSRLVGNGAHTLQAVATDSAGASSTPATVAFTTDNDFVSPTVTLTSPVASALIRSDVSILGTVVDDRQGTTTWEVRVDGVVVSTGTADAIATNWNTLSSADGAHEVSITATDAAANQAIVSRAVFTDNTPPSVAISGPLPGLYREGVILIDVAAADVNGISRVDFFRDGVLLGSDVSPPFSFSWNSTGQGGLNTLTAVATDAAGNVATSTAVAVTVATSQVAQFDPVLRIPRCTGPATQCSTGTLTTGRGPLGPELNAPNALQGCADGSGGTFHGTGQSIDQVSVVSTSGGPLVVGGQATVRVTVWSTSSSDRVDIYSAPNASSPVWTLVATLRPTVRNAASTLSANLPITSSGTRVVRAALRTTTTAAPCPSGSRNERDDLAFLVP